MGTAKQNHAPGEVEADPTEVEAERQRELAALERTKRIAQAYLRGCARAREAAARAAAGKPPLPRPRRGRR